MICTRCDATGFLNLYQVDEEVLAVFEKTGNVDLILEWIVSRNSTRERLGCACHISPPCPACELAHDVQVCDCCGDGEGWYGVPGEHADFSGEYPNELLPGCY